MSLPTFRNGEVIFLQIESLNPRSISINFWKVFKSTLPENNRYYSWAGQINPFLVVTWRDMNSRPRVIYRIRCTNLEMLRVARLLKELRLPGNDDLVKLEDRPVFSPKRNIWVLSRFEFLSHGLDVFINSGMVFVRLLSFDELLLRTQGLVRIFRVHFILPWVERRDGRNSNWWERWHSQGFFTNRIRYSKEINVDSHRSSRMKPESYVLQSFDTKKMRCWWKKGQRPERVVVAFDTSQDLRAL